MHICTLSLMNTTRSRMNVNPNPEVRRNSPCRNTQNTPDVTIKCLVIANHKVGPISPFWPFTIVPLTLLNWPHLFGGIRVDAQIAHDLDTFLVDGHITFAAAFHDPDRVGIIGLALIREMHLVLRHFDSHPRIPFDHGDGVAFLGVPDQHLLNQ